MRVTINRPEVLNALNPLAHYELAEAFDAFANDHRLHVATISGTGDRAFCVGTDLKARAESGRDEHPQTGFAGLTECYDLNEPVVALVNGDAIGGGLEIVLACDLAIAVSTARFGLPEPKVGLAASGGLHRQAQREQNLKCLEEAAELGVRSVVTITGGLNSAYDNMAAAREAAVQELSRLIPTARELGLLIALEPLHPMVCGMRSVISTLDEACGILDTLDSDDVLRPVLDSYAVWWDADLQSQILRAGNRISNFHVSDWLPDTRDLRLDRGMPGDGLIDNALIRSWVEETGYHGPVEVEIFSDRDWWLKPPDTVVETIRKRLPFL